MLLGIHHGNSHSFSVCDYAQQNRHSVEQTALVHGGIHILLAQFVVSAGYLKMKKRPRMDVVLRHILLAACHSSAHNMCSNVSLNCTWWTPSSHQQHTTASVSAKCIRSIRMSTRQIYIHINLAHLCATHTRECAKRYCQKIARLKSGDYFTCSHIRHKRSNEYVCMRLQSQTYTVHVRAKIINISRGALLCVRRVRMFNTMYVPYIEVRSGEP